MNEIFEILGLIAWVLCFSKEVLFNLKNYSRKEYFKDFKNKFWQVVRFDKLLLIIIFIIYIRFNKDFITALVFTVICLYMYINKLYEKSKKDSIRNIFSKHWITMIIVLFVSSIPFVYVGITHNIDNTYILLLFYIFFSYFIVGIATQIKNLLFRKKR